MYTNTNPAELYSGTTWELIAAGKYIQTGSTPLSTGGSNSISITKANLPNIKLKVDSTTATIPAHVHGIYRCSNRGYFGNWVNNGGRAIDSTSGSPYDSTTVNTSSAGAGNTGTISPSTESLGNGTALTIQPAYITLKFWKRLT